MVREFCIRKAHDERFIRVLSDRVVRQGTINERHISFINGQHITPGHSDMINIWAPTIHTILYFHLKNFPCVTSFLRNHKFLRIFEAMSENSTSLPSEVFDLFDLRYLALTCSSIPSTISNLMNLQTLIILPTSRFASANDHRRYWVGETNAWSHSPLPLEIWRMPQLRHVLLHHAVTLPHPPDGSNPPLENLQTLSYILNLVWNENVLLMIPNVKRLGLVYDIDVEFNLDLLRRLDKLEKLVIETGYTFEIRRLDKLFKVKTAGYTNYWRNSVNFPSTLKKLTLVGGGLPWKDMSVIGSLPNLQVLKLRNHACRGETWETVDGEFPDLRYLLIVGSVLQQWITESSHFPRLKYLVLRHCQMLREIPGCIGEIPTLEVIEVDSSNQFLVESAKQIKEDQESYGNYDLHVRVTHSREVRVLAILELYI
ncbi:putative late blight resistance protein homolog R1B-16 [Salvia hispanica]|uniref:putative late blight resistance protein homolog R1B-16 n=1 Tax=Salvia hispanica TaxID=49212 RepID=UPI002009BE33|nr:putative late blight resistance protein homolog R1B-16 [Salvia hispanica]